MRKRTRPVSNVEATPRPDIIWNYDPKTGSGPLHISTQSCFHNGTHKSFTRCGRAMNPDHHIWHLTLSLNTARLCKRCGTVLEFEQALAEYRTWELRQTEERKAQRKKEEAERSTARDRRLARLAELASFLVEAGLRVGVNAERGMAIVEHAGREFEIKESKESDD